MKRDRGKFDINVQTAKRDGVSFSGVFKLERAWFLNRQARAASRISPSVDDPRLNPKAPTWTEAALIAVAFTIFRDLVGKNTLATPEIVAIVAIAVALPLLCMAAMAKVIIPIERRPDADTKSLINRLLCPATVALLVVFCALFWKAGHCWAVIGFVAAIIFALAVFAVWHIRDGRGKR